MHSSDSFKSNTINSLSWSFIELVGVQIVQFITGIILARLLYPEQFGLVGMITVFIAVAQTFLDSGFGDALIQKRDTTIIDSCSIFYFNIAIGLVATSLLCVAAPWIALFYDQPILTSLTRALSFIILIESFGLIQSTILTKNIDFKTHTKIGIISIIISAIIGIFMAINGFGVWSLVAQQLSRSIVKTLSLWIFNSWRPNLMFSFTALRGMFGYGSRLLISSLLNRIFDNLYYLIIGKLYNLKELGLYTRAKLMKDLPSVTLSQMVTRVTFPIFSSIQDDRNRLKFLLRKTSANMAILNFPMMVGLALISRPLIHLLLTEKWSGAVVYMQFLCLASLLIPFRWVNMNVMLSMGLSGLYLRIGIIDKIFTIASIAITYRYGLKAIILGSVGVSIIMHLINNYFIRSIFDYSIWLQLFDILPYMAVSIVMGAVIVSIGFLHIPNNLVLLICQIAAGAISYLLICRAFRLKYFMETLNDCFIYIRKFRESGY